MSADTIAIYVQYVLKDLATFYLLEETTQIKRFAVTCMDLTAIKFHSHRHVPMPRHRIYANETRLDWSNQFIDDYTVSVGICIIHLQNTTSLK